VSSLVLSIPSPIPASSFAVRGRRNQAPDEWWWCLSVLAVFEVATVLEVVVIVIMEVGGVLFCIKIAREFNPA